MYHDILPFVKGIREHALTKGHRFISVVTRSPKAWVGPCNNSTVLLALPPLSAFVISFDQNRCELLPL